MGKLSNAPRLPTSPLILLWVLLLRGEEEAPEGSSTLLRFVIHAFLVTLDEAANRQVRRGVSMANPKRLFFIFNLNTVAPS